MAYEPLHHKYRPQVFADLVGQDAIATTLTNAIQSQRIAPAYLFTGPRGTGKTSSARILAKSLNCLQSEHPTPTPCGVCSVCQEVALGTSLDVIEIDAASNTGVDNIRDLIERAQFAPVQCRFKIYCLDEVHMLSTAAFNALLKTLEEPPDRVVFILATTDPQRVLPTIISRCQRFDFRRINLQAMVEHLTYIANQETIAITPSAVELVAQVAQGGLRDAESLLDQLSLLAGEIDNNQVWDLVGSVPEQALLALLQAIVAQQPAAVIERTHALLNRGREPLTVLQNLAEFYRDLLIAKTAPDRRDLVAMTAATWTDLCKLAQQFEVADILANQQHLRSCEGQIKNSTQPRLWLEVSLLGLLSTATVAEQPTVARPPVSAVSASPAADLLTPVPQANNGTAAVADAPERPVEASPSPALSKALSTETPVPEAEEAPAARETEPAALPAVEAIQTSPSETIQHSPLEAAELDPEPLIHGVEAPTEPASKSEGRLPTPRPTQHPSPRPATPTPQPSSTPAPPPPTAEVDLNSTWQQLLEKLNLPSRALLKEHGQLLYWQGREVRIGIRKTLLRLAQGKVAELEETFEACFNRKVKVTLKILTEEQIQAQSSRPQSAKVSSAPSTVSSPTTPPAPPAHQPTAVADPPQPASSWQSTDEFTSAARSFAQFFNGALVEIEPKNDSANND
ncbi:DNA polymerase III subunit gamma/tau [Acaryochloris sp. IP29b_bin.148]|uniref:DNA polymerase III subunit gamma/tau n=1 Tax=Acaryochloris sp. IP29b_bin.148 TaxID=2969218 RepID=UPI00261B4A14|nr:DNA polymerase III subunit gamma/tau [Acaryochloris sp. IP29b_bin.148]